MAAASSAYVEQVTWILKCAMRQMVYYADKLGLDPDEPGAIAANGLTMQNNSAVTDRSHLT